MKGLGLEELLNRCRGAVKAVVACGCHDQKLHVPPERSHVSFARLPVLPMSDSDGNVTGGECLFYMTMIARQN